MKRLLLLTLAGAVTLAAHSASAGSLPPGSMLANHNEITVGAGLLGYFSGGAPATGGSWEVRYAYSPIPLLAIEAGYIGAAADQLGPGANVATILEGGLKFNPFRYSGFTRFVNPYFVGGIGYGAFTGTSNSPSDKSTVEFPFGAGADIRITDRISTGGRFTYRLVAGDSLGPQNADLDNWQLTARVNAQF